MKVVNFWKTLVISALAITALAGCSKSDEPGPYNGVPSITLNGPSSKEAQVTAPLTGGQTTPSVTVTSTGTWILAVDPQDTWIHPSATSGENGGVVTFTVDPSAVGRTGKVILTTSGSVAGYPINATATINVRQGDALATNVKEIREYVKDLATEAGAEITEEKTLTGIVISNVEAGGTGGNKSCYIADNTTDAGAGIVVRFNSAYTFAVGTVISGSIKGSKATLFNSVYQISMASDASMTSTGDNQTVQPILVSDISKLADYQSQLVKIDNVQPTVVARGAKYVPAGTTNYATTKFETTTGVPFDISIYKTNTWATTLDVPAKSGSVVGIISPFNGVGQVCPRSAEDVAGLTNEPVDVGAVTAKISEITAAGTYKVIDAIVVAISAKSLTITDSSNALMPVYLGATTGYALGDKLTAVEGTVALNGAGPLQFSSPEVVKNGTASYNVGAATRFDAAAVLAWMATPVTKYVEVQGILTVSGNYYNLELAGMGDGSICKGGSIDNPTDAQKATMASLAGKPVVVKGFAVSTYSKWFTLMLGEIVENTTINNISAADKASFAYDATSGSVSFTANVLSGNKVFAKLSDATWFTVPSGVIGGNSVAVTMAENTSDAAKTATLTIYIAASEGGEMLASVDVVLTQAKKSSGNDTKGTYTSMATFVPAADNSTDSYYTGAITANGNSMPTGALLKLGTGSKAGKFTTGVLGVTGNKNFAFYGVAWKDKTAQVKITVNGGGTVNGGASATVDLAGNIGATGNPPFTVTYSDDTDYFSFSLADLTANSTITIETVSPSAGRAVMCGMQLY